jgi:hypothetical protein
MSRFRDAPGISVLVPCTPHKKEKFEKWKVGFVQRDRAGGPNTNFAHPCVMHAGS